MVEPIEQPEVEDVLRWHRTFAPRFFNRTWELMDMMDRSRDEIDEMLTSAFAQRAHWYQVGDARQRAIADWQVSRAAVLAGFPTLARRFGERSLQTAAELDPFVAAFGHEAIARAAALVDDEEEREVLVADLAEMSDSAAR